MRKKTIKIFYSWQDDIDGKLNRSFIKECLESVLHRINKTTELEEANRPKIKLDHDTKDVPGIPDITNTILQKISSADIFIADLTFVSEYKNHKGVSKKISNQNVIFELGFAFNILGPHKIVCIFNEAFGHPKNLLFDLQSRRWPITFDLPNTNSSAKKLQKGILVQKLDNAISSIINAVPLKKGKSGLHNPFSASQHNDFEYLYNKLNIEVQVHVEYQEKKQTIVNSRIIEKPCQHRNLSFKFQPALVNFIAAGNECFTKDNFSRYIGRMLALRNLMPDRNDCYYRIEYNKEELELPLRTLGLISSGENKFLQKIYKFIHWLDFNGYKDTEINIKEL